MRFKNFTLSFSGRRAVTIPEWVVSEGESWVVLGGNGSGKSTLARFLSREIREHAGVDENLPQTVSLVSLEQAQSFYEKELANDETDFTDIPDEGSTVREILTQKKGWSQKHSDLTKLTGLEPLLESGYRTLSSGEARKTHLVTALLEEVDLLILDEPFEGLDAPSTKELKILLKTLILENHPIMLFISQIGDMTEGFTHAAVLDKGVMKFQGTSDLITKNSDWSHFFPRLSLPVALPPVPPHLSPVNLPTGEPLISLRGGRVAYGDKIIFENLNFELMPKQHTKIVGANGSGKSTLLSLITGDHSQCYSNDLTVFGHKRGSGESVWQIKKLIGYVSGAFHRDYRVSSTPHAVILSGMLDSIGVYKQCTSSEKELANEWLGVIHLESKRREPFQRLSMGEQRLVLIARALIKHPPLLILDEPTQGLDDANRFFVLSVVERLLENSNTTLLFVSHRADEKLSLITREFLLS